MEKTMKQLKRLSVAALMVATVPLAASSPSLAAGRGPGWCTSSSESAVGAAGPAMNGGQLMAGVGQCRRLGSHNGYGYWNSGYGDGGYGYGYGYGPGWETPAYAPY
jgi:hypothetical protein